MNDFSVLESIDRVVTFRGEQLKVSPLKMGQIPAFTRAIRPCIAAIAGVIVSVPPDDGASGGGEPEIDMNGIVNLISDHGDALMDSVSIATKLPLETVKDTDPEEFLNLMSAVIAVNVDFFGRAMAKARAAAASHRALVSGAGLEPSNS